MCVRAGSMTLIEAALFAGFSLQGLWQFRVWVGSFPLPVTVPKGALLRGFL